MPGTQGTEMTVPTSTEGDLKVAVQTFPHLCRPVNSLVVQFTNSFKVHHEQEKQHWTDEVMSPLQRRCVSAKMLYYINTSARRLFQYVGRAMFSIKLLRDRAEVLACDEPMTHADSFRGINPL